MFKEKHLLNSRTAATVLQFCKPLKIWAIRPVKTQYVCGASVEEQLFQSIPFTMGKASKRLSCQCLIWLRVLEIAKKRTRDKF